MFSRIITYFDNSGIFKSENEEDLVEIAGATLAAIYCGRKRSHPLVQAAFKTMDKYLPSWEDRRNIEYLYFGIYAKFQQCGPKWKTWNEAMKETLLRKQHSKGRLDGSWDPVMGTLSRVYGRNYTCALNALTLEIYYRYARAAGRRW